MVSVLREIKHTSTVHLGKELEREVAAVKLN